MFSGCGTSYPRKKEKSLSLLFATFVCSITLRKKTALKKRWIVDCRLEIIETGLIKITKIHRVAKCHRQRFFHASTSWELFPFVRAPEWTCFRVASVFPAKKNIVKERTTIERETYVQKGGWAENERQREERDRGRRRVMPLSSDIYAGGSATWEEMIKRDVRSGGCSLSPRIVRRCRCFSLFLYLVVPFPNFTLQIPLLTLTKVDAVVIHLANLLQLHYKEDGESLREIFGSSICLLF